MKIKGIHAAPALLIATAALLTAAHLINIESISKNTNVYLTQMVMELIVLGVPAAFFCLLRGGGYIEGLRLRGMGARHLTLTVWAFLFLAGGVTLLSLGMYLLFPNAFAASSLTSGAVGDGTGLYMLIAFALLPALLLEFLFRGVVCAEYATYGAGIAVLLSSLSFGLLHFSFVRLPIWFFMGLVLALTAGAARSLLPAILVHGLGNTLLLFGEPYLYRIAAKHSGGLVLFTFFIGALTLVSAIMFFSRAEGLYYEYGTANLPPPLIRKRGKQELPLFAQAMFSPTFLLFVLFAVILAAIS